MDMVNDPPHYKAHPSGVECIEVAEHMNFCLGNATKYLWRSHLKHADQVTDLRKAIWYIQREIQRIEAQPGRAKDAVPAKVQIPLWPTQEEMTEFYVNFRDDDGLDAEPSVADTVSWLRSRVKPSREGDKPNG